MRLHLAVSLAGVLLLASGPSWAGRGAEDHGQTGAGVEMATLFAPPASTSPSGCGEPSEIGANEDCTLALDDEVMLAAELLIAKLGSAALDFALERARHHQEDKDSDAADLWRRIAETLGEMAALTRGGVPNR
jgi:hypothetical protein